MTAKYRSDNAFVCFSLVCLYLLPSFSSPSPLQLLQQWQQRPVAWIQHISAQHSKRPTHHMPHSISIEVRTHTRATRTFDRSEVQAAAAVAMVIDGHSRYRVADSSRSSHV